MSVIKAFSAGFRRVTSAPFLLVTLYLLTLFFAIPVSLVLHDSMELNLDDSRQKRIPSNGHLARIPSESQ